MTPHPPAGGPGPGERGPGGPGPGERGPGERGPGGPGPGRPAASTQAPGPRRLAWRAGAVLIAVVAVAAVTAGLSAAAGAGHAGRGGGSRAISVTAGSVATVDLQAVPGQLTITGVRSGRVRLTGELDWTGHAPVVATGSGPGRVLRLTYRCATASPCTANWRLAVPRRTAVVLREPAGHIVVSGLAGPLQITAGSVDVAATGLRCPSLAAVITSGHLGAAFAAAPRRVSITLTSAQATLWLPGSAGYAVTGEVTAGYLDIGVPQAATAAHTVTARVTSGELDLREAGGGQPATAEG